MQFPPSPTTLTMSPSVLSQFLFLFLFLFPFPITTNSHLCTPEYTAEIKPKFPTPPNCLQKSLASQFGWLFNPQTRHLQIAFGAKLNSETGWLAWGLNPHGPHMIGTRALIGIKHPNASLECHQYNITDATRHGCPLSPNWGDVGLNVTRFGFEYLERIRYHVIVAAMFLPSEYDSANANVVWQVGDAVSESQPLMHAKALDHFNSAETVDLLCGTVSTYTDTQRRRLRLAHGIMNIVGWGTLLPTGVIVARYFNLFPLRWDRWFAFHATCQTAGYIIGSLGWALGIWLGTISKYYSFHTHHVFGLIIFTFTTIQMLALGIRLDKKDKHRMYWNMYHHFLGYALLVLIWVNIFMGIHILEPGRDWKWSTLVFFQPWGRWLLCWNSLAGLNFLFQIANVFESDPI